MSAIFLPEDVCQLLKGKTVVYIGDSVERSMYKDLVLLFQDKRYLTDQELRAKGELCFLGDELMEGGKKGEMNNSTKYREVRKYLHDSQTKVLYFFITACFGEYIEMVLKKLMKPDIIFMNSCLWDVHRYGTKGYEGYGPNLMKLVKLVKELHPKIFFAWTTTPPVDIKSKAGFLEDRKDLVKINEVLRCNDIARSIMRKEGIPIADFADVFRHFVHHRAGDGVHWNEKAHRRMTNILLETVARHFNQPVPRPVSDDFNRMGDFMDRPPFPHSFSQPAFHHDRSWDSFDEERWHWDSFFNDYPQDDFVLGIDRGYGGGNYSFFESEDEMSPRFLPPPPHARRFMDRQTPPSMRPPLPPPGYRFGNNDPIMMSERRKRKSRDEELMENFNKRQRNEGGRKSSVGSECRIPSPLVENRPFRQNENLNRATPDLKSPTLEEKPLFDHGSVNRRDSVENIAEKTDEKADVMKKQPVLQREKEKADVGQSVSKSPERAGIVNSQPEEKGTLSVVEVEVSNVSGDIVLDEKPSIKENLEPGKPKVEVNVKEASEPETSRNIVDESKMSTANVNQPESSEIASVSTSKDDKSSLLKSSSVFGKLSATTSKILESIMNSSKQLANSLNVPGKFSDTIESIKEVDTANECNMIKAADEKSAENAGKESVEEVNDNSVGKAVEKSQREGVDEMPVEQKNELSMENLSKVSAEIVGKEASSEEKPASILVTEESESDVLLAISESLPSGMEGESKKDIEEKEEISFYDIEPTMEDIEASLDRMDDDICDEAIDWLDEESLLMDDNEKLPSPKPVRRETGEQEDDKIQVSVDIEKPEAGKSAVENNKPSMDVGEIGKDKLDLKENTSTNDLQKPTFSLIESNSKIDITHPSKGIQEESLKSSKETESEKENKTAVANQTVSNQKAVADDKNQSSAGSPGAPPRTVPFLPLKSTPIRPSQMQGPLIRQPTVPGAAIRMQSPRPLISFSTRKPNETTVRPPPRPVVSSPVSPSKSMNRTLSNNQRPCMQIPSSPTREMTAVPMKTAVLNKPGVSHNTGSTVSKSISPMKIPNTSITDSKSVICKPLYLADPKSKPKIPCVPNPPSLNMKSPFFRPKISANVKTSTSSVATPMINSSEPIKSSGTPVKSSTQLTIATPNAKSNEVKTQTGLNLAASTTSLGVMQAALQVTSNEAAKAGGNVAASSAPASEGGVKGAKGKKRKIKSAGKKATKKAKTDEKAIKGKEAAENVMKDGNVVSEKKKKKKKKKLKSKKEKPSGSGKSCVNETLDGISLATAVSTESNKKTDNSPQIIAIVSASHRPKSKPLRTETYSRGMEVPKQTAATNAMPTVYVDQTQRYQQQIAPTPYFQNFTATAPQLPMVSQNVAVQPFQYGQHLYTNHPNQLGFAQQYNPSATNTLYTPQTGIAGYQGFDPSFYNSTQIANQTTGVTNELTVANAGKGKEYAHLAWL